ncbi:hypothetical protein J2Y66_003804 [Paenarthrobacter nitroguajacolicus]|uniref:hypothetical protein n=1 Tax=Paenarthrobacter nitroguajacolicus TaxID=211146 RepID=UPI0028578EF3|nr:hypothetical protein [Paenarthrobacter nitroguajacolicus]MDR6989289.1 hypothetical protein [Paenarthrobacter nitroguajacolicus]
MDELVPPQDWTFLSPGEPVQVHLPGGQNFEARVETKTRGSEALWVIRADSLQTRQVFSHTEGVLVTSTTQVEDRDHPAV